MKIGERNNFLPWLFCSLLFSGILVDAVTYDYSFTSECLENPKSPQYDGGIVKNPELRLGLKGWTPFGYAKVETRASKYSGNKFIVAHHRNQTYDSVSQTFFLEKEKLYTFSAWLQVSDGNADIAAIFKTPTGFQHAAWVTAQSGCWSMLKGGLVVNASGPAQLYFETKTVGIEIWVDSVSLQPFSQEEWTSHQDQSTEKISKFPFGCAVTKEILTNTAYQNWFTPRFRYTVFGDEMKWYSTENVQGRENYSVPDAMLQWAQSHGIAVRGHNIFWDDYHFQLSWVTKLNRTQLIDATTKRINSIVRRYSGKLIAWDVVNENLHYHWFEDQLGQSASTNFYRTAHSLDWGTTLFLNDYNTIEEPGDSSATPDKYLAKVKEIQAGAGISGHLAIGLEGHFGVSRVNLPYMRSSIDKLATAGLPIWITELDVSAGTNQAWLLDQILREARAHPAINGVMMWAGWKPSGCWRMCLTDNNFKNLATGDVVDKIIGEWSLPEGLSARTDADGFFEASLFHGDYEVRFSIDHEQLPDGLNSSFARRFTVDSIDSDQQYQQHVKIIYE